MERRIFNAPMHPFFQHHIDYSSGCVLSYTSTGAKPGSGKSTFVESSKHYRLPPGPAHLNHERGRVKGQQKTMNHRKWLNQNQLQHNHHEQIQLFNSDFQVQRQIASFASSSYIAARAKSERRKKKKEHRVRSGHSQ